MSIKDYLGNMKALLVKVHDLELKSELLALLLDAQGEALDLQERLANTTTLHFGPLTSDQVAQSEALGL